MLDVRGRYFAKEVTMRLLFLALCCLVVNPALAEDVRILTADPGETVIVSQPHHWASDCSLRPVKITITELPQQGRVWMTQAEYEIGDFGPGELQRDVSGTPPCLGQMITGLQVLYRSADGAKGTDAFSLTGEFVNGKVIPLRYKIEIAK